MTDEAKKDLLAVMDQLEECRRRHGMGPAGMFITNGEFGRAEEYGVEVGIDSIEKQYEPAGGNRTDSGN